MKNKFMTKALAVVLSASMALSLSSATALTANGAAAPKLTKKAVTVKVGKKAKNKLAKASFKAGWRITKATVKKTKVAKATFKKNKKVVVVTGVQKGKSKVVVALKNVKTGAAKKVKFTVKVKVDEVKPEPVVVEAASIVSATQTTVDEAVITFSKAPETDVTRDTMKIYEGGKEYVPTAVTMAADKLSATVSYAYAASTDTTTYEYTFKDANLSGEASFKTAKYEVATVDVKDQTVEAGSLQPVTFALLTENGVDITKANAGKLLKDVNVDFVGDDVVDKSQNSSNPQVFLSAAGKTCKMTVTYLPGQEGKEKKAEATITAVQPTQTKAEARWAFNDDRWYIDDENISSVSLYSGDPAKKVYFYAKQTVSNNALTFKAVEYARGFDVKSSDEDVATVTVKAMSNKYAMVEISPLSAGTTTITLIATEEKGEGIEAKYELPVRVNDFNHDSAELKASTTAVSLTNAIDNDWSAKVGINLFNPNNEADDHSYKTEIYDSKNNATTAITVEEEHVRKWDSALNANTYHINIWAFDKSTKTPADAGTYRVVVKATGVQGSDTKDFEKTIFVNVKEVAEKATDIVSRPTFKYEIALSSASLELKDDGKTDSTTVSIKAMIGSDFAGYVRRDNATGKYYIGQYRTDVVDTTLGEIQIYVLSGAKYVREVCVDTAAGKDATFYLGSEAISAKDAGATHYGVYDSYSSCNNTNDKNLATVSLYSEAGADVFYFGNNKNEGIAAAGTYGIIAYNYSKVGSVFDPTTGKLDEDASTLASKKSISVSYKLTLPKLDYNKSAREDYVTPDRDFLLNGVKNGFDPTDYSNSDITVVVAKDRFATYKVSNQNASVIDWAYDAANKVKANNKLAGKDTAKAVILKYFDRAGGMPIYFVVEKDNTISD